MLKDYMETWQETDEDRILQELSVLSFYHGCIDSTKAVGILRYERPGSFLLRKSTNPRHSGAFTVSVIKNRSAKKTDIYHFTVLGEQGSYYAMKGLFFNTIIQLLDYYRTNDFENHLDIPGIKLLHPVNKGDHPYSYATVEGRFENLLTHLRQLDEGTGEEICECGIPVHDAILPNGWMMHQTPIEPKKLFFQHDELNLTQWEVPDGIWPKVRPDQRKFIRDRLVSQFPM